MSYARNAALRNPTALMGQWYDILAANRGAMVPFHYPGRSPWLGADAPALPAPPPPPPQMMAPPQMVAPAFHPAAYGGPQPSAYLTELAPPDSVKRFILPMSTGVPILPTQSAQITGRPQGVCYVVERCLFSNAGTPGGAADWICNDIKIGNQSQFIQSGDVPGDMFATNAIDTYVSFQPAQTAMDVVLVVTYIGSNESGAPFYASMLGRVAI